MVDDFLGQAAQVSVIVPTIGRPASMSALLESLVTQTAVPGEVLVADASADEGTSRVVSDRAWSKRGLAIRHLRVSPPNAVRQRVAAINASRGTYLLLLDDDVELDARCVEEMLRGMASMPAVVAVVADFSNQRWSGPTRAWRAYMRIVLGLKEGEWEGKVVGPLLRFGFPGPRELPATMEWIGTGSTLVVRSVYERCGGFSDFFLHRSTLNEDVDLGIKLGRQGTILFWPAARLAHHHAPGGRVSVAIQAEDDVYNRFQIMRNTMALGVVMAFLHTLAYMLVETASNIVGSVRHGNAKVMFARIYGRAIGFAKAVVSIAR
jgi:GT2 family glycosyltransferase